MSFKPRKPIKLSKLPANIFSTEPWPKDAKTMRWEIIKGYSDLLPKGTFTKKQNAILKRIISQANAFVQQCLQEKAHKLELYWACDEHTNGESYLGLHSEKVSPNTEALEKRAKRWERDWKKCHQKDGRLDITKPIL